MDPDDTTDGCLDLDAVRRGLRTLGTRPSRSAEEAFERDLAAITAMTVRERVELALRLGRRDRQAWLRRRGLEGG